MCRRGTAELRFFMDKLKEKLKNVPALPGVYIMKSAGGEVIYVGKSKKLKNRVRQYFQKASQNGKVGAMVENICDFEYIVTDTEIEALVLECNLIKKYKPHYNILLKDSKQYPYIKISMQNAYPKMTLARKILKDGAKYYGPYTGGVARETMEIIRKTFKIHTCGKVFPRDVGKTRPCLNYHINLCCAPCAGKISQENYRRVYDEICRFLEGKLNETVKLLKKEMNEAAQKLEFEKAAELRDKISKIEAIAEEQKITVAGSGDRDIVAIGSNDSVANVQIFNIRDGKLLGRNQAWLSFSLEETDSEVLAGFITGYYMDSEYLPREIMVNIMPENADTIEKWLGERGSVKIRQPQRGMYRDFVEMALKNVKQALSDRQKLKTAEQQENKTALEKLSEAAGLGKILNRIEAYDISNIQGTNSVGSMVVFENGARKNSEYRYFKIKTVTRQDDYASTAEVITRRFKNYAEGNDKFNILPDAVFADGGYGHTLAIEKALSSLNIHVPVFGMVKDAHHRTKSLITSDGEIIELEPEAFALVTEIQNEVHRVAISYHRKLREAELTRSALDEISGVGAKRKKALLRVFGSVKAIKQASIAEIAAVEGISVQLAEEIYAHLQNN